MEPERWQKIKLLFQAAEDLPTEARSDYLDQACGEDQSLRAEVESLLASQEQARVFLSEPAAQYVPGVWNEVGAAMPGRRIGHYEIVCELGSGGMGSVYLAIRSDAYRKQVALKLLKRGMNSDFILSRFRAERQILASLDHPNIARLLDGGATGDERPYFVMEYIEGAPIDRYCQQRELSIADKLKLFRLVCSAVHYAHQNLVVHRDLKPGNILVTADGVPKLLDFGIAKLLNPELAGETIALTSADMRLMTPEYASPEQVRGLPITTASDVYSLGVILYELLTGDRPYRLQGRSVAEIDRIVCEQEPERPSAGRPEKLHKRLKGELDNIVLKSLRKEAQRRYSSVEQLSEDVRRHLEGLPVAAQSDTIRYRTVKFVKRNWAGVAAAVLLLTSLVGGIAATSWQARVAGRQRARAERRFNDVRKLANSFLFEFHDAIEKLPGSTVARQLVVKKALEYLDSLAREARGDASLERELAEAYIRVGTLQGNPNSANLGDIGAALKSYQQALRMRQDLATAEPGNAQTLRDLAASHTRIGELQMAMGQTAGALVSFRSSLEISQRLADADASNPAVRRSLAFGYGKLGEAQVTMGETAAALESQRRSLALCRQLAAADPANRDARNQVSWANDAVGALQLAMGDANGAIESLRESLRIREELAASDPNDVSAQRSVALAYYRIGDAQDSIGQSAEELESYRRALAIILPLSAADPKNVQMRRDLGAIYARLGDGQAASGRYGAALESYRKSLAIGAELAAADPRNARARADVSVSYNKVGAIQEQMGQLPAALENYRASLRIRRSLVDDDPKSAEARRELSVVMNKIGSAQAEMGQVAAAAETTRKALAIADELARSDPGNSQAQSDLSFAYTQLGKIESKSGNAAGAIGNYRKALEIDQRLAGAAPRNWQAQTEVAFDWDLIAESQASLGQSAKSIESYRQSIQIREAVAAGDPKSPQYRKDLASSLLKAARLLNGNAGSGAEARRMCQRALQILRSLAAGAQTNEDFLITYARALLDCEPADLRDSKEALRQVLRAGRMAKEPSPELLDTRAGAYFENGDVRQAIAVQEQALALLPATPEGGAPAGQRKTYLDHLRRYRAAYGKK